MPTGFDDLDRMTGGLQRSDMIVVAARPGQGKTSLLLNIALNAAKRFQQRVAIFSLEMSHAQLTERLVAQEASIDSQRLRTGDLRDEEWPRFVQAQAALGDVPIVIDDTPALSIAQLRAKARRLDAEHAASAAPGDARDTERPDELFQRETAHDAQPRGLAAS